MIYLLLGVAVFVVLAWAGRRARPTLEKREWRIVSGALSAVTVMAGAFVALRGGWLAGLALAAVGVALALTARRGALPAPKADDPEFREALAILGVEAGATRDEIKAAYGRLIRALHPDVGGSSSLAARLNAARDKLLGK